MKSEISAEMAADGKTGGAHQITKYSFSKSEKPTE